MKESSEKAGSADLPSSQPRCPVDGSVLQRAILDTCYPPASFAWQCAECAGTWLPDAVTSLFLEYGLSNIETRRGHRACPSCPATLNVFMLGALRLERCEQCRHIWFDPPKLLLARRFVRQAAGCGDEPWLAMLGSLQLQCSKCGCELEPANAFRDGPMGIECARCSASSPWGPSSQGKRTLQDGQEEVTLELGTHAQLSVALAFESPVTGTIRPPSFFSKFFSRAPSWAPAGLRVQSETAERLRMLLSRPGCGELLEQLAQLGLLRIEMKPRKLSLSARCKAQQWAEFERLGQQFLECLRNHTA